MLKSLPGYDYNAPIPSAQRVWLLGPLLASIKKYAVFWKDFRNWLPQDGNEQPRIRSSEAWLPDYSWRPARLLAGCR